MTTVPDGEDGRTGSVVAQALSEAACRVRALRDLASAGEAASDLRRELTAEEFAAYVWNMAARTAMFLAVAQERLEAA